MVSLKMATESHEILVNVFPDEAPYYATEKMVLKIRDGRDPRTTSDMTTPRCAEKLSTK